MLDYKLKIALVPIVRDLGDFETRKGIFEPQKGVDRKNEVVRYIKDNYTDGNTSFTDLEWLNSLGVLYKNTDCDKVIERIKEEKADAIFIVNCNFGNEEAEAEWQRDLSFLYFCGDRRILYLKKTD